MGALVYKNDTQLNTSDDDVVSSPEKWGSLGDTSTRGLSMGGPQKATQIKLEVMDYLGSRSNPSLKNRRSMVTN